MWLKQVELQNFQKHPYLKINFTKGVNIIHGSSDAGKSCVRRAIEWVCQNTKIDGARKSGTKLTSVRLTLHNDIIIERQRSASINRYIIHKDGEEQKFDSIGKTIPEEVKNLLQLEPINIDGEDIYLNSSPQIALPFLFDRSPSFRMKLFNKLTGNDVLDKLFVQFNKDILSIGREYKRESEQFEIQTKQIDIQKGKKKKMEAIHKDIEKQMIKLREISEKHSKLLKLKDLIINQRTVIDHAKELLKDIKIPDLSIIKELTTIIERLDRLREAENALERTKMSLSKVRAQLSEIKLPTVDFPGLYAKIERVNTLENLDKLLDKTREKCYTLREKSKKVWQTLLEKKKEYHKLLKLLKICPTCNQEITEKCLEEIKL